MPRLDFLPSKHAFHFVNGFTNRFGPIQTQGLCGGMALAVFNYYRQRLPIPTHKQGAGDFGTEDDLPPQGGRLRNYIFDQQIGSFASALGFLWFIWPGTPASTVLRDQFRASLEEWTVIRRAIDRRRFVLVGLRNSELGNLLGHQVLAYGYDDNPKRVYVYDPNFPDQEMMVEADERAERVVHKHADGRPSPTPGRYGSFFVQLELDPHNPDLLTNASRPSYLDLGLQGGIRLSPPVGGDTLRRVGERLEVEAVVRNFGDHPAHVQVLGLWARDPRNRNRDADWGHATRARTIAPGEEVRIRRVVGSFGDEPGAYRLGISYLSEQGHWINVPAVAGGARSEVTINLVGASAAPSPAWITAGAGIATGVTPAVGANADNRLEVFVRGRDGRVHHTFQRTSDNPRDYSLLSPLPGEPIAVGSPRVVRNQDERLEVFARGRDNALWHCWQNRINALDDREWSGWTSRGGDLGSDPAPTRNQDRRVEVFVIDSNGVMHKIYQRIAGGWWSGFEALPAPTRFIGNPTAHADRDGRLVVAACGSDRAIWVCQQETPNGPYGAWQSLGGVLTNDPVMARNADGRLEIFAQGQDNRAWHRWQDSALRWTGGWRALDDHLPSEQQRITLAGLSFAVALSRTSGGLVVAATVANNRVVSIAQAGGGWGAWRDHGGLVQSAPGLGINPGGVLELYAGDHLGQLQRARFPA